MAYWNAISGLLQPIPIRQFDGVYAPEDAGFNLPDNLFTELVNFGPDEYPAITTRTGYVVIGSFGAPVLGMGAWKNQELHVVFGDGTWRKWDWTSWTTSASGLNGTAEWTFTNFKGNLSDINLIGANGVDPIKRFDGSTVQNLANAPSGGKYITTHSNRLYCAVDNLLKFSALNEADDWTTVDDAGEIAVNTTDGETINGLSAGNGYVTVFKPSSMYELYGKGPQSYSMDQIAADIGATGNKAVAVYDESLPFTSRDGIYRYAGGIRPSKVFSDAVQQLINGMNKEQASKCVSGSDGLYLYFAYPSGTAAQNDTILQYSPRHQTWYTWKGIAVTQMVRVGTTMYFGDDQGRVLRLIDDTDNGQPITATAITKPFTAAAIARKQHWLKMWVVASLAAGSTLSIYISGNAEGNDWRLVNTFTASTEIQYRELLVPTNSVANANAVRLKLVATGKVTIHEITRLLRELPMRR